MSENVQCAKCGLLTIQSKETRELEEVTEAIRKGGRLPLMKTGEHGNFLPTILLVGYDPPKCSVFAHDLPAEYDGEGFVQALNKPRPCESFISWHPGFSPKEHREMKLLQQVSVENQTWQRQQEALAEIRHQELRKDNRKMVFIAGAVAILAAIIGGMISRQWN